MGKISSFNIIFNREQEVYFPGQTIDGYVTVTFNEAIKARGIVLSFKGLADVYWTEKRTTGSAGSFIRTVTQHFAASENYFDDVIEIVGKCDETGDIIQFDEGKQTFPFRYTLPLDIPSSFEGKHGFIRYYVKAIIPRASTDYVTKNVFTVNALVDFNREPLALNEVQASKSKSLCFWCCRSGPISINLNMDRRAYVPGEDIRLVAEISNKSNRRIHYSSIKLIMVQLYYTSKKSKSVQVPIKTLKMGPIHAGESCTWPEDAMRIPPLPPSYMHNCRIIDVKYVLELRIVPEYTASDLVMNVDLLVGNIPLRHRSKQSLVLQTKPDPCKQMLKLPMLQTQCYVNLNDVALAQHTLEDCPFGKSNVREKGPQGHVFGTLTFVPSYVVYNNNRDGDTASKSSRISLRVGDAII